MKGNFNKIIQSNRPVLVDFFATWCGPCKMQLPIIKEVAKELKGEVRILKIDIDKNKQIAHRFKVKSVPTLMAFKNSRIVWRASGVQSKKAIVDAIRKV